MKCYYHEDREAVAQCQNCGKALCKECASKHTPCYCDECFSLIQTGKKQKRLNALVDTRAEYIKACIIGAIIGIILVLLASKGASSAGHRYGFFLYAFAFFFGFFIPFGWGLITSKQGNIFVFDSDAWFVVAIVFLLKCILSCVIGIFAFIYQTYITFRVNKQIKNISEK